ncbi:hypothetical protein D3C85_1506190 [compost metagenome]
MAACHGQDRGQAATGRASQDGRVDDGGVAVARLFVLLFVLVSVLVLVFAFVRLRVAPYGPVAVHGQCQGRIAWHGGDGVGRIGLAAAEDGRSAVHGQAAAA